MTGPDEQSHEERDKRRRQPDAIDRLAAIEPLPVPESLSEWNREYSRMALLKILELGDRQIEAGQVEPASDVFQRLRKRHRTD
ncbi:MAG: hypothetical protein OXG83_15075 [Acidobacteria bacterium]|nr:hypothetical protein [Acidobacteriota bacterium]